MRIYMVLMLTFLTGNTGQAQMKKQISDIQTIGEGTVWRISNKKDSHDRFLPPWTEIQIINVFEFKRRPAIGEKATVIPLGVDITPLSLRITKAEKKDGCDERIHGWWAVELEPITLKEFFDIEPLPNRGAETPFDVAIIYPAVKVARQIRDGELMKVMLPKGVPINTVKAAIDLTDDGKPDVVIVKYCCDDASKPASVCDYTCGKTFTKVRNTWKLIDTSAPC
jgi:hypothetical protein